MPSRTPTSVDKIVQAFCEEVSPGEQPVWLDNDPTPGPSNHCFPLVEERVAQQGGEMVLGWSIWIWPAILIEAEFHGVWRDPQGQLHDLVPRRDGTTRILFLLDTKARWEGRQVNNIRKALSDMKAVHDFIQAHNDQFDLLNRGEYATQYEVHLTPEQQDEYAAIQQRKFQAELGMLEAGLPIVSASQQQSRKWVSGSKKRKRR